MRLWAVKVPRTMAEHVRRRLLIAGLIHPDAKICQDGHFIFIPVIKKPDMSLLNDNIDNADNIDNITIIESDFEPNYHNNRPSLEDELGFSPAYDIIGDIALIDIDDQDAGKIANALILCKKNIKVVLGTAGPVSGEFRTRDLVVLAGEHRTHTIHTEFGCRYKLDLSLVYFSHRLGTERKRVVDTVRPQQKVIDLFAGVGPFSILIAKSVPGTSVVAVDKNPKAVQFLKENIRLNKLDNVVAVEDDARQAANEFRYCADHVIMNLPHSSREFLNSGMMVVKNGGLVHFYDITPEDDLYGTSWEIIQDTAISIGRKVECVEKRIVRSYAPHQYNVYIGFRLIDPNMRGEGFEPSHSYENGS
ncbi:MAG: class I SAM-dependent methyltransferase family protein [Methanosarcinales archaeon]|nr:class I SAM-dependent methyltransferase family protein [Methanosarcinales archaeon]